MPQPTEHRQNIELKVRCSPPDLSDIRRRLDALLCAPLQRLHQVDTYLQVPRGRLKVRELRSGQDPLVTERAEIVAYVRPTEAGSRLSVYQIVPIAGHLAADLLAALLLTHDELARVDKVRDVGIVGQTRVHLDDVAGLGTFVELETVLAAQGREADETEHRQVIDALGLHRFASVAGSYSDLILERVT